MKTAVKKWGNSASVRIPAAILQAANLKLDEPVEIRQESGRIVITPLRRKEYDLAQLLKGITRGNLHGEATFGEPVGKEALYWRAPTCLMLVTSFGYYSIRRRGTNNPVTARRLS